MKSQVREGGRGTPVAREAVAGGGTGAERALGGADLGMNSWHR